jgi:hypothetical protein
MNGRPDGPVHFHYPAKDYMDDLLFTENLPLMRQRIRRATVVRIATRYDDVFRYLGAGTRQGFTKLGRSSFF